MAHVQYATSVPWDSALADVGFLDSENTLTRGLVISAVKTTTGAPAATAGYFAPGAIINNIISHILYTNTGTTASPVWSIIDTNTGGLPPLTNTHVWVGNASNVATDVAVSGDATMANTGALTIANDAITNVKVAAAAAIDFSKLAALPSTNILVGSVGNVPTAVAMSGDATLSNVGALTIGAAKVTGAKLVTQVGYFSVAKDTNSTTPVDVIAATVPFACTITGVYLISKDTTASNITVTDTAGTVATIAKGTSAGVMVGATSLANTSVASGDVLTIVSSGAGEATVFITFTVA